MVIEIPTIDLKQNIYNLNSPKNNVEKNVKLIKESNIDNNYLILAAHSGNNNNTYFNNIIYLTINDLIYIYNPKEKLIYSVTKKYTITKSGYLTIDNDNKDKIILITCNRNSENEQIIIEGKKIKM